MLNEASITIWKVISAFARAFLSLWQFIVASRRKDEKSARKIEDKLREIGGNTDEELFNADDPFGYDYWNDN